MKVMYKYFILGVLLIMLPSCIFDDGEPMIGQQDPMMITFTLDVQSPTPTKGDDHTWGDNDDDIDQNGQLELACTLFAELVVTLFRAGNQLPLQFTKPGTGMENDGLGRHILAHGLLKFRLPVFGERLFLLG